MANPTEIDILAAYRRAGGSLAAESLRHALLTMDATEMPVLLADDERDGFVALVKDPPNLWVDDVGRLETEDRAWEVRVLSVHRIESEEEESESDGPRVFRLGLDRVRETAPPDRSPAEVRRRRMLWATLSSLVPIERSKARWRDSWVVLLIAIPLLIAVLAWKHDSPAMAKAIGWSKGLLGSRNEPHAVSPLVAARRLSGVDPFLLPEVAACLNLSDEQRAAMLRLHGTTQQAIRQLDAYWKNESLSAHSQKQEMILIAARKEALRILTDQQRQQWEGNDK